VCCLWRDGDDSIRDLVDGDDGLPAEDVGIWAKEKHSYLRRYVDMSRGVRHRFIEPNKAGAVYIDPYCGTGRARVRETGEFIDGGAVAAWKQSVESGTPFTRIYIGDLDPERVDLTAQRLAKAGALFQRFDGSALEVIEALMPMLNPHSLHFTFLDPYSLRALDFRIIKKLAQLKRVDILVHVNQMDLQRNLGGNLSGQLDDLDVFAPGWRDAIDQRQSQERIRSAILHYWRKMVADLGVWPSTDMKLITASKNQPLYWLLLAAKHELALAFWKTASNPKKQGSFAFD
jgi:three-Cys-motif partner protein